MKKKILLSVFALAMSLAAASIDGKWTGELQPGGKNPDAKKMNFTLDLKAQGEALSGTVTVENAKGKGRSIPVTEGKLTGDNFRFVTIQKNKNGENKLIWSGTVKGDELTGTRGKDGAKKAPSFAANRAK